MKKDPEATKRIISSIVPRALWEVPTPDDERPHWFAKTEIGWTINPDDYERARRNLAEIVLRK